jgi:uncharacterized Zn-binding protein involved in type VI secretion
MNTGFALATSKISDMLPKFPAATLGSLYVAPLPHCHSHPLSLVPPNPVPVPLPSLGPIMFGMSIKVLINGLPAARAGDIGLAPTCFGFTPFFEVKTGSSKVFIGGQRAARAIDFCSACVPGGGAMDAFGIATLAIGTLASAAGVVADTQEAGDASAEGNAAMAAAKSLSAAMGAAQMAADAATMAIKALVGKDPSVPPMPSTPGMITPIGCSSTVLIGGFPMVNFPDPMAWLYKKLKAKFDKGKKAKSGEEGCPTCKK